MKGEILNTENNVLYVIENGFDINLGLKTSYNDFFSYSGVDKIRDISNLLKEHRKDIHNYSEEKKKELIKKVNEIIPDLIDENNNFAKKPLATGLPEKEKINNIYGLHKEIFVSLKSLTTGKFVDEYGLFILFLILIEVEKNEWQWVEEQIVMFVEEFINILSSINFNELSEYVKFNWNECQRFAIDYAENFVIEKSFYKTKKRVFSGIFNKNQEQLLRILKIKSKKYLKSYQRNFYNLQKLKTEKIKFIKDMENTVYEIEYINFILEILLEDSEKKIIFTKDFRIKNINEKDRDKKEISLKQQFYIFENYFGNYIKEINEKVKNFIESNYKDYSSNKIFDFSNFKLEKIKKIFSYKQERKYIINFNYTNYLNNYIKNKDLNIKEIININGNVDNVIKCYNSVKKRTRSPKFLKALIKRIVNHELNLDGRMRKINSLKKDELINNLKQPNIENLVGKDKLKECIRWFESKSEYYLKNIMNIGTKNNIETTIKTKFEKEIKELDEDIEKDNIFKNRESKIIFGIDQLQIENHFKLNEFIKSNRRSDELEKSWKNMINKNKFKKIYFFGHSFSKADYSFFKELFDSIDFETGNTKLIFMYNEEIFKNKAGDDIDKEKTMEFRKSIIELLERYFKLKNSNEFDIKINELFKNNKMKLYGINCKKYIDNFEDFRNL